MERPSTSVTWGNYRTLPGDKQNEANETDGIFSTSFILVVTYVYVVKSTIQHYFNSSSCPTNTEICVTTDSLTLDKAKRQFFFLQDLRRMGCEPRTFNLLLQFLGRDTVTKISCWLFIDRNLLLLSLDHAFTKATLFPLQEHQNKAVKEDLLHLDKQVTKNSAL